MRRVTVNGVDGYAITPFEFNDMSEALALVPGIIRPPGECLGYEEATAAAGLYGPIFSRLESYAPATFAITPESGFNLAFRGLRSEQPGEPGDVGAAFRPEQEAHAQVAPLLTGEFTAFVPGPFPEALGALVENLPYLLEGRCLRPPSPWPLIVAGLGLGAVGLTAWGVARAVKTRKKG